MMIDEISLLLGRRIVTKVATLSQIADVLKKTEQSQRVLEEAGENFALDVITEDENADETISIEKLTARNRSESDHPPGRYHYLHRPAAASQRYSHRDAR